MQHLLLFTGGDSQGPVCIDGQLEDRVSKVVFSEQPGAGGVAVHFTQPAGISPICPALFPWDRGPHLRSARRDDYDPRLGQQGISGLPPQWSVRQSSCLFVIKSSSNCLPVVIWYYENAAFCVVVWSFHWKFNFQYCVWGICRVVCVCMCVYVCVCVCLCVQLNFVELYVCSCMQSINKNLHYIVFIHAHTHILTYKHTHTQIYTSTHAHTVNTHNHTHTHTHTCSHIWS